MHGGLFLGIKKLEVHNTMSVLAQITSWILDRIIENLARKHRSQTRSLSATSHVISMVYAHLPMR